MSQIYAIPACLRDELSASFFALFPKEKDSQSIKARAILESLAIEAEVDVSRIECGHATVREYTMQRGRGHFANLPDVSAKLFCRFIGKQSERFSKSKPSSAQEESSRKRKGAKRKREAEDPGGNARVPQVRGGGAWRAFLAENAGGVKLDRTALGRFSQLYHSLSHDEYQRLREIGLVATLAARGGVKKPFAIPGASREVSSEESSLALVYSSHQDVLVKLDGESFEGRFASFKRKLTEEHSEVLKSKKGAGENFEQRVEKSRQLVEQESARIKQHLSKHGRDFANHFGFLASPSAASLQCMEWIPPTLHFAKVPRLVFFQVSTC